MKSLADGGVKIALTWPEIVREIRTLAQKPR